MSAGLLDLNGLAAESGVPVDRLQQYAETGLLSPALHGGDGRFGYPAAEAGIARLVAGADGLGLDHETVAGLALAWRGECAGAHERLTHAVSTRLDQVRADLAAQQTRAAAAEPGSDTWAEATRASVSAVEDLAGLQAVDQALAAGGHAGPCGPSCGCAAALSAPGHTFYFPSDAAAGDPALSCDLAADGGDAHDRTGVWQQVLNRVESREPLSGEGAGVVLRFPFDVDLAATLARLAASEYRCCSFGSYTIVVDGSGLRLEIRMPDGAQDMLTAVVGR